MSRIEAALEDLTRLQHESSALDEELAAWSAQLGVALDEAWATSSSFLLARGDLDQQLWAQLRAGTALADGAGAAATRLARAGTDGPALRVVPPWSQHSPARRLALQVAAGRLGRLAGQLWSSMGSRLSGRGRRKQPHVVHTRTETYGATLLIGEGSTKLIWEDLSDGTVRITAVQEGAVGLGIGVGVDVVRRVAGVDLGSGGGAVGAGGRVIAGTAQSWVLQDQQAAQRFWDQHRPWLLGQVTVPGGALGAALLDRARDKLFGESGLPPAQEAYVDISLEAAATAGLALSSGVAALLATVGGAGASARAGASYRATDRLRIHQDGSVTVMVGVAALADAALEAAAGSASITGDAAAGFNGTIEVTTNPSAQIEQVVLRTTFLADPGEPVSLSEALGFASAAATTGAGLHEYESTLTLDLTDPEVRALVEGSLGVDLASAPDQLQTVLATLQRNPAVVAAARVSVIERGAARDSTTTVGFTIDVGPMDVGAKVQGGTISQSTEAAWEKPPGDLALTRVS